MRTLEEMAEIIYDQCDTHSRDEGVKIVAEFLRYNVKPKTRNTVDLFWDKVDKKGPDECWNWQAGIAAKGRYGSFKLGKYNMLAHRAAYILTHGEIPEGESVLHRCDNPACVNPNHLFLGTQLENMKDRQAKNRQARGKTNGRSKVTDNDVSNIRAEARSGSNPAAIARAYGVSRDAVSDIISRKTWKHVP